MKDSQIFSQNQQLRLLLQNIENYPSFYSQRLNQLGLKSGTITIEEFCEKFPFTTKSDLASDREINPPFGTNFTESLTNYTRFCQTSGTSTGKPLAVLDTHDSWQGMLECWSKVYEAAGVKAGDRIFFAFSFGPFLGFWTAFEAAARNCLAIPGGGLSSSGRLDVIYRYGARVICGTPTYLMRLGEVLQESIQSKPIPCPVELLIVAGEPGGCQPTIRQRLSELWNGARVFDHHGLTEVGPVSYEHPGKPGWLVIMEEHYLAEIIDPQTTKPVSDGQEGELVLTTLSRRASPLLRYRTGDLVKASRVDGLLCLEGGVIGRCDDMRVIRGVNIYPAAIENILATFPEIIEYQIQEHQKDAMIELHVLVEVKEAVPIDRFVLKVAEALRSHFALRISVESTPFGSLPRFEFKAKRWIAVKN